jgi:cell division protein FtsB
MAGIAALAVALIGVVFAAMGGEYSTLNWWQLRRSVARERAATAQLEAEIDSLGVVAEALEKDPFTQERVAREAFGMLRPGEIIYRVVAGN